MSVDLIPYLYGPGGTPVSAGRGLALAGAVTADMPSMIDPATITFTDSPQTISVGGTYTGLKISAADGQNCVEVTTDDVVIFQDCIFEHSDGDAIYAPGGTVGGYGSTPQIEVYNCLFLGRHPVVVGATIERAIRYSSGSRLIVENSQFQRGRIQAYHHSADPAAVLRVRYNVALNIDGRQSDASGNPTTTDDIQQFFQINGYKNMAGAFEIAWNEVWNEFGDSAMEDAINIYAAGGTASNLIRVHHNLINGAYPGDPAYFSYAGGGIMLSDGPGDPAYGLAEYNVVLASANYGMAITAGSAFEVRNNRVFRTGKRVDGATNAEHGDGPGIYVYDYGSTTAFGDHVMADNTVRWQEGSDPAATNNTWVAFPGTNFTDTGNTYPTSEIDQAFIDAEVLAFRDSAGAAGVTIGRTP